MEKRSRQLLIGCISIIVLSILLIGGCTQRQNQIPTGTSLDFKTCEEQNGHECDAGVDCECGWVDASDTFRCCECECESDTNEENLLTVDEFDENPENEEVGEVYE